MAIFRDFDINTASTPGPWGPREEQMVQDLIQTVVDDTISGVKHVAGHRHGKLYNALGTLVIDAITSNTEITLDNDVEITGDLSVLGSFTFSNLTVDNLTVNANADINNLDVTTNIDTDTLATTGTASIYDLNVSTNIDTATAIIGDLDVTTNIDVATIIASGTVDVNDLDVTTNIDTVTMNATGTVTINDLDVTTNIDADTMNTGSLDVTGTADINNLDVQTNIDTATIVVTNTGDFEDTLYGDLFDLDDNLAIQTRQTADKTIKFYPTDKGGYDFHLDSSTLDFRIHDGTAEFFRIHIPSFDVEATFDIPVNFNDDVSFNAGVGFTGTVTINDLDVTTNIDTATMTATGTVNVNDLNVTTNIDTATIISTGTATLNDLDVTTNIDTATLSTSGTATLYNVDITTDLDVGGNADVVGRLTADIYNLYDDLAIQTRAESYVTNFYPSTGGGYDFNLNSSIYTFRVHDASTELMTIDDTGMGIGIVSHDGTLHVHTSTAGSVSPSGSADDLIVEAGANAGISIFSPDANYSSVFFGSPSHSAGGAISWKYDDSNMLISTTTNSSIVFRYNDSVEAMRIDGNGRLIVGTANTDNDSKTTLNGPVTFAASTTQDFKAQFEIDSSIFYLDANMYYSGGWQLYDSARAPAAIRFYNQNADSSIRFYTNNANDVSLSNQMIIDKDGNVGIGTTSPGSIDSTQITPTGRTFLEVSDSDNWSGLSLSTQRAVGDGDITSMILFGATNETSGHGIKANIRCYVDGSTAGEEGGKLDFQTKPDAGSMASRMVIDEAGNIGIGTTTPTYNLELSKSGPLIACIDTGTGNCNAFVYSSTNGADFGSLTNHSTRIFTNNIERMRIDTSGNVGIGVNPTNGKLEVNAGTADTVAYFESTDANAKIVLKDSNSTQYIVTQNSLLSLGVNASLGGFAGNLNIDGDGAVSIGSTTMQGQLHVYGDPESYSDIIGHIVINDGTAYAEGVGGGIMFSGDDGVSLYRAYAGIRAYKTNGTSGNYDAQLHFQTRKNGSTATTKMVIDQDGNVGIGTSNPAYKLDIITGSATNSSMHIGEFVNEGGYITSLSDNNVNLSGGMEYANSQWTARSTNASMIGQTLGTIRIFCDSGLTDGGIYTPTERFRIQSDGKVGIGVSSPACKLDVNSRWPILLGSDYNSDGDRTNSVTKLAISSSVHYTNAEENVVIYNCYNDSSSSNINIGGGDANFNACTKIRLVTAANNTTVGGTNRVVIDENGYVYMYYLQSSAGDADMRYNTSTGELTYDTSALKYKENIRNDPDTSWVYNIPIKMYDRIDKRKINEIGIIADDLKEIAPAYCCYNKDGDIESYNKSDLVPVLLAEIQKHENRIKHLETRLLQKG